MTLIAHTYSECPLVISDILWSSSCPTENFKLPTFLKGVEKYLPDLSGYPAKLAQKTYIIKNNLVISVTGELNEATDFIKTIKSFFSKAIANKKNVEKFISEHKQKAKSSGYLILLQEDENQNPYASIFTSFVIENPSKISRSQNALFGDVIALGSGSKAFIDEVQRYETIQGYGATDPYNKALSQNLLLTSRLLARENFSLETIKEQWGAGFELTWYDPNLRSFTKKDNFTYIIWYGSLDLESKQLLMKPYLILGYQYLKDILLISSYLGENPHEGFAVLPIDMNREEVNPKTFPTRPILNDQIISNTFILKLSNNKLRFMTSKTGII